MRVEGEEMSKSVIEERRRREKSEGRGERGVIGFSGAEAVVLISVFPIPTISIRSVCFVYVVSLL